MGQRQRRADRQRGRRRFGFDLSDRALHQSLRRDLPLPSVSQNISTRRRTSGKPKPGGKFDCKEQACSFQLERAGIELVVGAFLGDQIRMSASLDNLAVVEHHDGVVTGVAEESDFPDQKEEPLLSQVFEKELREFEEEYHTEE